MVDSSLETSPNQVPQFVERRSERRKIVDLRIKANTDWILTLDEKVDKGLITPVERAEYIARSMVARELLTLRASSQAFQAKTEAEIAKEDAKRDPKTRLWNSEQFALDLENLISTEQVFGFLLLDIDHFKQVNDRFGHSIGDRVLVQTAQNVVSNVRQVRPDDQNDKVYRYGGEEIAILLIGMRNEEDIKNVAEKIRTSISGNPYVINEKDKPRTHIPITVSIGAGIYRPGAGSSFFDSVDKAMYAAKNEGRNRTKIVQ